MPLATDAQDRDRYSGEIADRDAREKIARAGGEEEKTTKRRTRRENTRREGEHRESGKRMRTRRERRPVSRHCRPKTRGARFMQPSRLLPPPSRSPLRRPHHCTAVAAAAAPPPREVNLRGGETLRVALLPSDSVSVDVAHVS